jgi:starch phosphorylase
MHHIQTFQVLPSIPEHLGFLETLTRNIWWCWQRDAVELLRRINPSLWAETRANPILFLTRVSQERLEELARDGSFRAHMERVQESFQAQVHEVAIGADAIAYFSMEFGLHESIPLYSGGLGVLAGDHLKAASDLTLPLVGVGLLYRQGYFSQFLDPDGWQQETYPDTDLFAMPISRARDAQGQEVRIAVTGPGGDIHATVWQLVVGNVPLYLLDTNIRENPPDIREITARLYAGGGNRRLTQELVLGIGGMRALAALGIQPAVVHMNEGHSAFASLERLAQIMEAGSLDLKTALEIVPRTTVFTTHTPVAAGHDDFPVDIVQPCIKPFEARLGIGVRDIMAWGQAPGAPPESPLSMFILGKRMAAHCNGVSALHGAVARRMWAHLWNGIPENEVPISHITNGIHIATWVTNEIALLFERYLGPEWHLDIRNSGGSRQIEEIYDEELWHAHELNRARLIRTCRKRMVAQYGRRNASSSVMREVESVLDQDILTIAFARRFATYKRAALLLKDPDRLEAIVNSKNRPVQLIFAGKAHPLDNEGKELIRKLVAFANQTGLRHRVVFLENYDLHLARRLVQGADVWLNNPRRPFEACGTSGMKAAVNGVLNLSVLDGWWCEGYHANRGWRIGNGEEFEDSEYQDRVEAQALYNVLENDVIPCFYERENGGLPLRWLKMMKASIKMVMQDFSAQRMVDDYRQRFYRPAADNHRKLLKTEGSAAKTLSQMSQRLAALWQQVRIEPPVRAGEGLIRVGERLKVTALVHLGELSPEEVWVELCYGPPKSVEELDVQFRVRMSVAEQRGNGDFQFACDVACSTAGRYGFTARVTPKGDHWTRSHPGWITWA